MVVFIDIVNKMRIMIITIFTLPSVFISVAESTASLAILVVFGINLSVVCVCDDLTLLIGHRTS